MKKSLSFRFYRSVLTSLPSALSRRFYIGINRMILETIFRPHISDRDIILENLDGYYLEREQH